MLIPVLYNDLTKTHGLLTLLQGLSIWKVEGREVEKFTEVVFVYVNGFWKQCFWYRPAFQLLKNIYII